MNWKIVYAAIAALSFTLPLACRADVDPPVVKQVDLARYAGTWYEIAHSPNFFQGRCERSTANYGLRAEGGLTVLNRCYAGGREVSKISGVATASDPREPAKLTVDFGFFRRGAYWITRLTSDYGLAVVSGPGRRSIFILARQAPLPAATLKALLSDLAAEGYDTGSLIFDKY